jgi:1,4-alpha-glucan branching enzyme
MRVPEEIWPGNAGSYFSKKRSTLGAAFVFTAPGIPMTFQGQEFLESGYFSDSNPLDWTKELTFSGILTMYRDLIKLRRNWSNHTAGLKGQSLNVFYVNDAAKVIAFHRWDRGGPGDDVIVVMNMASQSYDSYAIGFPRDGCGKSGLIAIGTVTALISATSRHTTLPPVSPGEMECPTAAMSELARTLRLFCRRDNPG